MGGPFSLAYEHLVCSLAQSKLTVFIWSRLGLSLLCIAVELAGGGYEAVAVGVGDMGYATR